ncbi:hypothetical protein [Laspinema olomoucense]|uniref:Uncharacterized protein n=1 Tax=Laspinema olomoucense D3b TaxID=2953688 RepID=A0ABT2NA69_9CYAN|nr:hypothetical protein [Laspinema sp. D3b]MCT7979594.1 hypothetical protein [Laspinema sp. D3b]
MKIWDSHAVFLLNMDVLTKGKTFFPLGSSYSADVLTEVRKTWNSAREAMAIACHNSCLRISISSIPLSASAIAPF